MHNIFKQFFLLKVKYWIIDSMDIGDFTQGKYSCKM